MTALNTDADTSSEDTYSDLSSPQLTFPMDCSPFLNWEEDGIYSELENVLIFRSLVATIQFQPTLDVSLEEKAVGFLESVSIFSDDPDDNLLSSLALSSDESMTDFIQSIKVLISTANKIIITTTIDMLDHLISVNSDKNRLDLVKADLISKLIATINPQSFSIPDCEDMHTCLIHIITSSLRFPPQDYSATLDSHGQKFSTLSFFLPTTFVHDCEIEDGNEQQAVHETVFQQVLLQSEQYLSHLCVNRYG
ncbi:hypothetical protein BLNAU_9529 [Blattamonas nauphoetae]|uniref:Uncharacterized protein n=1 Tax=Blattamonas nauphoetae TaxID=2049346 RepID=A0ABQ9XVI7_9EUKA|nr:hypothetical protein BLNAU_9529 [Blattamonas nauphoetae]